MARFLSDSLRIMRLAVSRRNENDPDSSDDTMVQYIQDFVNLTMSDDVKLFEQFGTLQFEIDETNTTGVYTFNDVGADAQFVNISQEAFISLTDPPNGSISWNQLWIYQDPGEFFFEWGVNNTDILIPGYPTMMLYYGNQFTFRTIPNTSYTVTIYGYKEVPEFDTSDPSAPYDVPLPYDYWLRYIAYGAAANYVRDYNYSQESRALVQRDFAHERKLLLTRTHNQRKLQRAFPRF